MHRVIYLIYISLFFSLSFNLQARSIDKLEEKKWFSGSPSCLVNKQKAIEVYQYDMNTYILRQNICVHHEAPFMYLLFGDKKALLIDTGASKENSLLPLANTIKKIMISRAKSLELANELLPLIVAHSHSHSDHVAADEQFKTFENANVIPVNDHKALMAILKITNWPTQLVKIELGGRSIDVIPSPGHQTEAISFYDTDTHWLLTGDTIYPGRLYIRQWEEYKNTIERLVLFSQTHQISGILGAHIEMSTKTNEDYAMGANYHLNETSLVLKLSDLQKLNFKLKSLGDIPTRANLGNMIIYPVQ
jgi:glyoxylase-like metal-dependent hydrolase (beta-lactamase superfamily II)